MINIIKSRDISDAWFQTMRFLYFCGKDIPIDRGSFSEGKNEFRRQYPGLLCIHIKDTAIPNNLIPEILNIPDPLDLNYIYRYGLALIDAKVDKEMNQGSQYTYGQRIRIQLDWSIDYLRNNPSSNQIVLRVSSPGDSALEDPPCLQTICIQVIEGKLVFFIHFRSWDIWAGMPVNLGGLSILQIYLAEMTGIERGSFICYSSGAHLYGYQLPLAKQLLRI